MHNIVILGANFAGTGTAHYLLRHVLPNLDSSLETSYKVTLISPSNHTFYKIAAARAIQGPTKEQLQKLFYSIPNAFTSYPVASFTFILGKAVGLDEKTQTLTIKTEKEETIHYNSLIIATGTTSNSPLWTLHDSLADTISAFEDINTRLASAKLNDILIVGGGAAGVETAGEVGYKFKGKRKTITLLSGTTELLPRYHHKGVSRAATSQLSALGVKITHNLRVISTSPLADGKTEMSLSDGSKKVVDLYIDATGGQPNTSFLPVSWLDNTRKVITETTTLRTPVKNVYAIGDVASFSLGNIMDSTWAIPALCYSIYEDLSNGGKGLKEKRYKQITSAMCFIPIGAKGGVGALFGLQLPSWFVWLLKSRDYMIGWAPAVANGKAFTKP
ncbi:AMID-like mitochondrial oxidoreductase [Tricladium varicosporioides]|nr:AMID-like mitochondrial oxidoreductase [Hymenoscyphus varicosporioides]